MCNFVNYNNNLENKVDNWVNLSYFLFRNDLQGFECSGMVIVSATVTGVTSNELISRCMSNLIIVSVDEDLEQLVKNQSFVKIIPAQGIKFTFYVAFLYFTICSFKHVDRKPKLFAHKLSNYSKMWKWISLGIILYIFDEWFRIWCKDVFW